MCGKLEIGPRLDIQVWIFRLSRPWALLTVDKDNFTFAGRFLRNPGVLVEGFLSFRNAVGERDPLASLLSRKEAE